MIPIAVTGATGRMGRTVLEAAADRDDVEVVAAINRDPDEGEMAGHRVHPAADLRALLSERSPAVLVDFTGPYSAVRYAETCAGAGVAVVSGTTGLDDGHRERLRAAADAVPVMHEANFARGVGVLREAVREAVAALPDYDVEVVETHHRGKRDAPSGTAGDLLSAVDDARGREHDRQYGRHGESAREADEVGVHSLRAGSVTGSHAVVVAGQGEHLRLEHRAGDRSAFAGGALDAAAWIADRRPGWYDLSEVGG